MNCILINESNSIKMTVSKQSVKSVINPDLIKRHHENSEKSGARICERSDLHGLNEFYQTYYVEKNKTESFMWLFVFLLALTGLIYFVLDASQEFFTKPILTAYKVQLDTNGIEFPSVYLCYSNPMMNFHQIRFSVNKTWQRENVNGLLKYSGNETGLEGGYLINTNTNSDVYILPLSSPPEDPRIASGASIAIFDLGTPERSTCNNSLLRGMLTNVTLRFLSEDTETSAEDEIVEISCPLGQYLLLEGEHDSWDEEIVVNYSYFEEHSVLRCVPAWTPGSMIEYYMETGPPDSFIKECSFGNRAIDCSLICTPVFDGDHGKCFKVDLPSSKSKQMAPGAGLSLLLDAQFVQDNGNLSNPDDPSSALDTPFEAVYLSVTAPGKRHAFPANENVLLLKTGTYTMVTMSMTSYELLHRETPLPVWTGLAGELRCLTKQAQTERSTKIFNTSMVHYSVAACQLDCSYWQSLQACGCVPPVDISILQLKHQQHSYLFCTIAEMNCSYAVVDQFADEIRKCAADCILPCEYQTWTLGSSRVPFPHRQFHSIDYFDLDFTEEGPLKTAFSRYASAASTRSKILLEIQYPQLQEKSIVEEYAMTLNNFLANVGGLFGLWLGPSLVSLFKLCYELVKLCINYNHAKHVDVSKLPSMEVVVKDIY